MPGMPGAPGFGAAPRAQPPPACQELMGMRDETHKHGKTLEGAIKKKPNPEELCKLFKTFLTAETRFIKGLEERSATCGVPPEIIKQIKGQHAKAAETGKRVCDAAAQGPRPAGPTLSDALGTTPLMPDSSGQKRGGGTFDTLSGSPLAR
jgi:hypothetical protein